MVFSSIVFLLVFLPIFLLMYHIAGDRYKNYVVVIASILFYSWGSPKFVFVIIASTIIDFYIVRKLYSSIEIITRKILLGTSIFLNLGLLLYFKYANFFVENVNAMFSYFGFEPMPWVTVLLPVGISFYTFQTLTYSIDVYRKVHPPLTKVSDYLLYIMSFPQMIAGPIVRFSSVANQIVNREETYDDKLIGFYRFSIGLAKKVLIANVMAQQADLILNSDLTTVTTANAWLGILAYTFQIYFDFSGYSDMAIGLGRMMGFRFPENFTSPYTSTSISEFWRRWHMTLGGFMRDYLYISLGGNRVKTKYRLYFNLWIVFLLSGLWHGAAWNFVFWGAFHGLFLILDRIFLLKVLNKIGKIPATLFTFFVVMIGWVVFRLENISDIQIFMNKLFSFDSSLSLNIIPAFRLISVFAIFFSFVVSFQFGKAWEEFFFKKERYTSKQNIVLTVLSVVLFILSVSSISSSGFNPFIYFRF